MSSETTCSFSNTCLSTPRRSRSFEDETVALAPDARRAIRKQFNIEFISGGEWHDESNNSENEKCFDNFYEKNLSIPLLKTITRSSIYTKHLITPKREFIRDSILSTGTPSGKMSQYFLDLTYDCVSVYGNDSDPESCYEKDQSPINHTDEINGVNNFCMESSQYYNSRLVSICKRSRNLLELDAGSDSSSELVQIMSKSLRLS